MTQGATLDSIFGTPAPAAAGAPASSKGAQTLSGIFSAPNTSTPATATATKNSPLASIFTDAPKVSTPPTLEQEGGKAISSGLKTFADYSNNILKGMSDPLEEAMTNVNKNNNEIQTDKKSMISGVADMVGNTAKGVAGMFGGAVNASIVKPLADLLSKTPGMETIANSKYSVASDLLDKMDATSKSLAEKWNTFASVHPTIADKLGDAGNVLNFMLLFAGDNPNVQKAAQTVADSIKSGIDAGTDGINKSVETAKNAISDKIKSTNSPKEPTFNDSLTEAQKIQNPYNKYNPTANENLYGKGGIEAKGKGIFAKDVQAPKPGPQDETLSNLVTDGKVSSNNLPSQNIQAIKTEVAKTESGINELVNRPELNTPFNGKQINKVFDNVMQKAKASRVFISDSAEAKAYQDVIDIAKEEVQKNSMNNAGLRGSIKSFNQRMESLLSSDIYKDAQGNPGSISQARIQAAKEVRSALNNFLGDSLDRSQQITALKLLKPNEAAPLIDKASNFANEEDFVKNQQQAFRDKILIDTSYRAEKRRIASSVSKGMSIDEAWAKEGLSVNVDSDLKEIWQIAHTDVESQGAGGVYKKQLQTEAHLLNAADDIGYNARQGVGKNKLQNYIKSHPEVKTAAKIVGGGTVAEILRKYLGL